MTDKTCKACSSALVRRAQENKRQWAKRRFCSHSCAQRFRTAKALAPVALEQPHGQSLTIRELQVVQCVARGMTNAKIGAELGLSPITIKQHLVRVGTKFGIGDRAGIVGAAIRRGYLQVPVTGQVPDGFDRDLFDVLVRIARGMSNGEIAADLHLTVEGTKYRVRRLLAVLGVGSREEAVAAGVACGALPLVRVRRLEQVAA